MSKKERSSISKRCKFYEAFETGHRFIPKIPIMCRLDLRSGHSFTQGMERPFSPQFSNCMIETTKYLVSQTNARIGYCQSDEISLVFLQETIDSQLFFDSKKFKMISLVASLATAKFQHLALSYFPKKMKRLLSNESLLPTFDARFWSVPTKEDAVEVIIWRVRDAVKNSISMAAQSVYSHKQLQGKTSSDKQEMLFQKEINWNDYPTFFKEGTFIQRKKIYKNLNDEELSRIPDKYKPKEPIIRTCCMEIDMPPFGSVANKSEVIFSGDDPICYNSSKYPN